MLLNIRIHFKIILWIIQIWLMSAKDIDECSKLGITCQTHEVCQKENDTYSCQCKSGWMMDPDIHYCVDKNECTMDSTTTPSWMFSKCKNTPGSYICLCIEGYMIGDDNASCVRSCDKNYCLKKKAKCGKIGISYTCICENGFIMDPVDKICVPDCLKCDKIRAECIINDDATICKCKSQYGYGSGLSRNGNNSCSFYVVETITPLVKGNRIAFMTELDVEFLFSFDIYPKKFVFGWHNVVLFSNVFGIWFHENGKGGLCFSKQTNCNSSEGFLSKSVNINVWSSIEIRQVFNGSDYIYTIKINNETVFSEVKQNVNVVSDVEIFTSGSFYEAQDGFIKDVYFINGNSRVGGIKPLILPPTGYHLENLWTYNQLRRSWKIDGFSNQGKPIYGSLDKQNEYQGLWYTTDRGILLMLNSLNYNTNIVLSAKSYMQLPCLALSSNENLSDNKLKDGLSESMLIVNVWMDYKASLRTTFLKSQVIEMYLVACQYTYLTSVNLSIDDIDECTGFEPPCSWSNGICENTYGSYLCKCKVGWMLNENSCIDINECTSLPSACSWSNGKCQNTIGSYLCTCETGWMIGQDNASCVDIDECVTMTNLCSWDNGICQNINGSYSCSYSNYLIDNSKNVYTLIENTTAILKETCLALIPILYKEYLLTFNIYPSKFNGLYYVICFSLQFTQGNTYCGSTIFDISLNEDGLLTFTKELYPKFQYTIGLNMWSNIEISQTSTIKGSHYKFTIKINNKDVYSIIIEDQRYTSALRETNFVRILSFEGVQIEKVYFINKIPNNNNEFYPVIIPPKGIEMEVIWILSRNPVVITKKFNKRLNGRIGNYQEPLGFWGSTDEGVIVIINQYWTKLPKINLNFRLSLVVYAYHSIDMKISYRHMEEIIYSRPIPLIKNSFGSLDEILTFDQFKDFIIFRFSFECSDYKVIVISADAALEDINECNDTSRCPWANAICENTFGSYLCKCEIGWELGKDNASCVDVNKCTSFPLLCSWNNGVCQNFNGSYLCTRQSRWKIGQDNASCVNIDECSDSTRCLWANAVCQNVFGTNLCKCNKEWELSEYNDSCVDINECTILPPPCTLNNGACQNTNGRYFCMCGIGWKLGQDNASCVENPQLSKIIGSILGSVLVLVIVLGIALFQIQKKKFLRRAIFSSDLYSLESYMDYELLPVDEWKISPTSINFDKKIGEGAFSNVFKAKISSSILAKTCYARKAEMVFPDTEASSVNVAVKVLKDGARQSEFDDFVEEINLINEIGYHKNIVNIIGCSRVKRSVFLVVEFMENGDLLQFLRKKRTKLIASKTDRDSLASIIFTPTFLNLLEIKDSTHEISIIETEAITTNDLLSFAWQVASGMEYLSSIELVHRDLAARNILVGANKNAKISDFGLTRKVNSELIYMGCNNRLLPIKWMSVEAIFDRTFTSYSDVWSYGVVLFEIVTLGEVPYPLMSNQELIDHLKNGYRMDRPDNCSQFMFDHMLRCWNEDPLQRPTFTELRELFEDKLSRSDHYFNFEIEEGSTNLA